MSLGKIRPNLIFYLIFPPVHLLAESLEISNGRYTQTYQMFCLHGDEKKNLKSGDIAFLQKSMKAMIWLYSSTVAAKTRHIWEWKPDLVRKNWKACAACSTSYNGQIEQFINLYKIPLVTYTSIDHFPLKCLVCQFSTLQDWSSSMFQCSKL